MATLSDFNGQASFTIGGNSFNNRASSGTPIYERTGTEGGGSSGSIGRASGALVGPSVGLTNAEAQIQGFMNGQGLLTTNATLQEGSFNISSASHSWTDDTNTKIAHNTFTFNFESAITDPVPIITPYRIPKSYGESGDGFSRNSQNSDADYAAYGEFRIETISTTQCVVKVAGPRMDGCTCLIL